MLRKPTNISFRSVSTLGEGFGDSTNMPQNATDKLPLPFCGPEATDSLNSNTVPQDINLNLSEEGPVTESNINNEGQIKDKAKNNASRGVGDENAPNDQEVEDMKADLTASKSAPLWDKYLKLSEPGDKAVLADLEGFLLESSKSLNPDPNSATVTAIRELTAAIQAGSQIPTGSTPPPGATSPDNSFKPSMTIIWVNCLWFLSLGLSISVSLFAMLAKRLCYKARLTHWGTPYERSVKRQEVWEALEKWKFEFLIEQLSMLMHVALILFFIGLVLYLSELNRDAMIITAIPIGLAMLSYMILTILPLLVTTFPVVTPFSRYIQSGIKSAAARFSLIKLKIKQYLPFLHARRLASTIRKTFRRIQDFFDIRSPRSDPESDTETQSSLPSAFAITPLEKWAIAGCRQSTGRILHHPAPTTQRYAFRALVWLLQHSNDKKLINEALDYVSSYPEVVLDSGASSQSLYEATLAVARHIRRLQHDPIEWHGLNTTQFRAKCGRFIYLNARPWLHTVDASHRRSAQNVYKFCYQHSPNMSIKEVEDQIKDIKNKKDFSVTNCIPWLERQAVKITLGCPPSTGLAMCKALFELVSSALNVAEMVHADINSDQEEEILSTLSWMFLNTVIDASDYRTFWPVQDGDATPHSELYNDNRPKPVANFDSTLTLSYFRHSEARKKSAQWLNIVGLSGILYAITYYPCDDVEPHVPTNHEYYVNIVKRLHDCLSLITPFSNGGERDPCIGMLPVYWESQIGLFEFNSLHYCLEALDRAIEYSRFSRLHDKLRELKDMILEGAKSLQITPSLCLT